MKKGVVLTALVPRAEEDADLFARAARRLGDAGVKVVEFYAPPAALRERAKMLDDAGLEGIYLAAIPQKRLGLDLCSIDKTRSARALEATVRGLEAACAAGLSSALITSGACPAQREIPAAEAVLEDAVDALYARCGEDVRLLLEPGDRDVEFRQLIGPTEQAVAFARRVRARHPRFFLTMDTSHIAQLGEDALWALETGASVCGHVHLANCVLDARHALYGDKHPMLAHPAALYETAFFSAVFASLKAMRFADELTLSLEVIARDAGPEGWMNELIAENPWFFGE